MRPRLAILALMLLALTVASPGIEAVAGCLELCPDEAPGQDLCSTDACCSCCLHSAPLSTWVPVLEASLVPAGAPSTPAGLPFPPARSSDILHVPKQLAA